MPGQVLISKLPAKFPPCWLMPTNLSAVMCVLAGSTGAMGVILGPHKTLLGIFIEWFSNTLPWRVSLLQKRSLEFLIEPPSTLLRRDLPEKKQLQGK